LIRQDSMEQATYKELANKIVKRLSSSLVKHSGQGLSDRVAIGIIAEVKGILCSEFEAANIRPHVRIPFIDVNHMEQISYLKNKYKELEGNFEMSLKERDMEMASVHYKLMQLMNARELMIANKELIVSMYKDSQSWEPWFLYYDHVKDL